MENEINPKAGQNNTDGKADKKLPVASIMQGTEPQKNNTQTSYKKNDDSKNKFGIPRRWFLKRFRQPRLTDWIMAIATVAIFFMGFLQWWAITGQWGEMQSASKQTDRMINEANRIANSMEKTLEQSKKALDASIEMWRQDQRAWVGIVKATAPAFKEDSRRVHIKEGEKIAFGVVITNSGKTPARKFRAIAGHRVLPSKAPFVPDYPKTMEFQSSAIIQPGMRRIVYFTRQETLTKEIIDAIKSKQAILYAYGTMHYEDIFGIPHKTTFCISLEKDLTAFIDCDTHNEAD